MTYFFNELITFTQRQARASLFGALLLVFMVFTAYVDLPGLHRYDYLFLYAVIIQILLILFKLETRKEVLVIFVFHIVATIMEIYKTSDTIGSWHYPGEAVIAIAGVPLFAGFMYSAVGSYIARAWNLQSLHFTNYPHIWTTYLLALAIYINFFTHHFIVDFRYVLVVFTLLLFWKTKVYFTLGKEYHMPLLVGFVLISFFIWIAENISTFTHIWLYPAQESTWTVVSVEKIGAWFLLMIISFVLVSLVHRDSLT